MTMTDINDAYHMKVFHQHKISMTTMCTRRQNSKKRRKKMNIYLWTQDYVTQIMF
jgi:hypothetical protein